VKGFKALGNQSVNDRKDQAGEHLRVIAYEVPARNPSAEAQNDDGTDFQRDEDGQIILF
jgi:topoisomerase-4 subunit A